MAPSVTQKSCPRTRALAVAVATCFATAPAWSLPTAPTVVNGTAAFNQAGNVLSVTNSNNAIINWQKFGIAAGEVTKFIQSSASSSVLNRVVGGDLSAIYGSLQSNGRVWLVNPAGILVGRGATIDTAAFVASTLGIRNEDFLAGKLTFSGAGGNVVNQGSITTPTGGSVYLVGANVENSGIINSPKGEVILAAGQTVNLVDTATPGVKVEITGAEGNTTNLGEIAAEAGRIGMAGVIVRNSGTLNASSAVEQGGRVFLKASQDTYVDGSGRIVATGTRGGRVEVLGNRVAVMDQASIDASGTNGGGTVLVGGDFQGKNTDIQNSQVTFFGPNAQIKANATDNGDGG
jgi:filamentous hemagglutinin family protein